MKRCEAVELLREWGRKMDPCTADEAAATLAHPSVRLRFLASLVSARCELKGREIGRMLTPLLHAPYLSSETKTDETALFRSGGSMGQMYYIAPSVSNGRILTPCPPITPDGKFLSLLCGLQYGARNGEVGISVDVALFRTRRLPEVETEMRAVLDAAPTERLVRARLEKLVGARVWGGPSLYTVRCPVRSSVATHQRYVVQKILHASPVARTSPSVEG